MTGTVKVGVVGAAGRMGRAIIALGCERNDIELAAIYHRARMASEKTARCEESKCVAIEIDDALELCDVLIDFTSPEASLQLARRAAQHGGTPLVIGTTGLTEADELEIAALAESVPIVRSGNFSLGLNMLLGLVEIAARQLSARDWDIEIIEAHHRFKIDAPSGTAMMLGQAAARGRNVDLASAVERARDGITGPRRTGAIGFAAIRAGGIVGEHSVLLGAADETLTLSHSAQDRSLFARGAIEAACWISNGKRSGLYSMMDVLGLSNRESGLAA